MAETPDDAPADDQTCRLFPVVYDELRAAAHHLMAREADGHTLQTTALVHEAYVRVTKSESPRPWAGPSHLAAVVVEVMRRILVESARKRGRLKRGGAMSRQDVDPAAIAGSAVDDALLALDEALTGLAAVNANWAELVKRRYFLGMTVPEAARSLGVSPRTADVWWAAAREWLKGKIALDDGGAVPERD
jgi:RNA polymerase sigma factor (TIGR02999 family)